MKQSELGSCCSTVPEHFTDPCPQALVVPVVSEAKEVADISVIAGDEVNSPVKKAPLRRAHTITSPLNKSPGRTVLVNKSPVEDSAVFETNLVLCGTDPDLIAKVIPLAAEFDQQSHGFFLNPIMLLVSLLNFITSLMVFSWIRICC